MKRIPPSLSWYFAQPNLAVTGDPSLRFCAVNPSDRGLGSRRSFLVVVSKHQLVRVVGLRRQDRAARPPL